MELNSKEFQIKHLGKKDAGLAKQLFLLFREVFEIEDPVTATDAYLQKLLTNPHFIVYAAMYKNEIVGGLTAFELPKYYGEYAEIFIYDIAVASTFQRKGIGKLLLSSLKDYGRQHNISEIFVAASEDDLHAVDFYHASGGEAEKVVHFTYVIGNHTK